MRIDIVDSAKPIQWTMLHQRLGADRRGVTAVEYALMGALVFLVIIVGVTSVGTALVPVFTTVSTAL